MTRFALLKFIAIIGLGAGVTVAENSYNDHPCRLWIAPSYISTENRVKLGLFAGVAFKENQTLPHPDLALPLVDFLGAHRHEVNDFDRRVLDYFEGMLWTAEYAGGAKFAGNHSTTLLVPGYGGLANFHASYSNIDWHQGSMMKPARNVWSQPGIAHPARGAITPYDNMTMRATTYIPAGMELFANFGDVWDAHLGGQQPDGTKDHDYYQDRFKKADYVEADKVLHHVLDFFVEYADEMQNVDDLPQDLLDFMLDTILLQVAGKRAKTIKSLLPTTIRHLRRVQEAGGTFLYRYADMIHSPEWFDTHGLCVDHVQAGVSTIAAAGRGAFATRSFHEGDTIMPVPMVALLNEDLLDMYDIVEQVNDDDENENGGTQTLAYNYDAPRGAQVAQNYAFGHAESSLLLFPMAPNVNLINHASIGHGANAYLTWSTHEEVANDHSLHDQSVGDLVAYDNLVITMTLQALTDIQPGDEILIDYGQEWVDAYAAWYGTFLERTARHEWPLKAEDVQIITADKPYPYNLQVNQNPYPPNVVTACFLEHGEVPDGTPRRNADNMEIMQWIGPSTLDDYTGASLYICDVMDRQGDNVQTANYTVYARLKDMDNVVQVVGVPHAAIITVDRPYSSDWHDWHAFRHWISMGDQRWPLAWRNLRNY